MKIIILVTGLFLLGACDSKKIITTDAGTKNIDAKELLIYSGRKEEYSIKLFKAFTDKTGIKIRVKQGKTSQLANLLINEGANSKVDLFFAQDSSNLGALSAKGLFSQLPPEITAKVARSYRSQKNEWVGTSGRARVLVYNKKKVKVEDLPKSMHDLTDPKWKGRLGWAIKNGSFQSHITAMIQVEGKEKTIAWLKAMKANNIGNYEKNSPIVKAVAKGEIDAGLVNHYYLYKIRKDLAEAEDAENHFFADGDIGMFVNISGVALMKNSKNKKAALLFIEFLLSKEAQELFKTVNYEYPLAAGVEAYKELKSLKSFKPVDCSLEDLDKIMETKKALDAAGCL